MIKKFSHSKKQNWVYKYMAHFKWELLREHSDGRDQWVYENSLRSVISLNGFVIIYYPILILSCTHITCRDPHPSTKQLVPRQKKTKTVPNSLLYQFESNQDVGSEYLYPFCSYQILFLWDSELYIVYLT